MWVGGQGWGCVGGAGWEVLRARQPCGSMVDLKPKDAAHSRAIPVQIPPSRPNCSRQRHSRVGGRDELDRLRVWADCAV